MSPDATTEHPRAILRVSRTALLGVLIFLVGTGPVVAADTVHLGWVVALPLLAGAWVLRVRTVADGEGLVARSALRSRAVSWEDVDGVRFPRRGWGRAVLRDGSEVWLPGVGFNDLRVLAVVSDGRVPDPFTSAQEARRAREAAAEDGATAAGPAGPTGPEEPTAPGLTW